MRKYLCWFILLCSFQAVAQTSEPVIDIHSLSFKEEVKTQYLLRYLPIIVIIEADGTKGQGIRVARNLILTDLSLVQNKRSVLYQSHDDPARKVIEDYIVADEANGLILLQTTEMDERFMDPIHFSTSHFFPSYNQDCFVFHKDQNKYIAAQALVPSRNDEKRPANNPDEFHFSKVEIVDKIRPVPGHLIFDKHSIVAGLMVYRKGVPYVANNRILHKILFHKDLEPKRLADLTDASKKPSKSKSKSQIFQTDILYDKKYSPTNNKIWSSLKLTYVERSNQQLTFCFLFKPRSYQSEVFNPQLEIVDLETGEIYRPRDPNMKNTKVYSSTTYKAFYTFENIPDNVRKIRFFNIPPDLQKYNTTLFYNQNDLYNPFFPDLIIDNYPLVKKAFYPLNENSENEGSVVFYLLENSNVNGSVKIYLDGKEVGSLSKYYSDGKKDDYCGLEATITLRLKPGEYKYKAVIDRKVIERKFKVEKGKCSNQHVKF
ncbi:MAG: hypothetical protein ABIN48_13245 [Ginsengibacter sp.]